MAWKNESRRHSLARKGVITGTNKRKHSALKYHFATGIKNPDLILAIEKHIMGLNKWDMQDLLGSARSSEANKRVNALWKETGEYPSHSIRNQIYQEIKDLTITEMIEFGIIKAYMVKPNERYHITFGSTTRNISGTRRKILKEGDILVYQTTARDGTTWFYHEGERGKHDYGNARVWEDHRLEQLSD